MVDFPIQDVNLNYSYLYMFDKEFIDYTWKEKDGVLSVMAKKRNGAPEQKLLQITKNNDSL